MVNTLKINNGNTKIIAHRGCSGLEKENTMASFIAGGTRTYYGMECDIHPTTDGVFVIIHDSDTARVAGDSHIIEELSYEEVKQIELLDIKGEKKHSYLRIPRFEDYLECCIRYGKRAVIEFKGQFSKEDVKKTLDIVKQYDYLDNCTFISFYYLNLVYCRELEPSIYAQFLSEHLSEEELKMCLENKFDLDVHYGNVDSKEKLDYFHGLGLKVNVWTVNDPELGQKLCDWGIDFITSNILEGK